MICIYLSAVYYHCNMFVTEETLLWARFSALLAVFHVTLCNTKILMNMSCNLNFV